MMLTKSCFVGALSLADKKCNRLKKKHSYSLNFYSYFNLLQN